MSKNNTRKLSTEEQLAKKTADRQQVKLTTDERRHVIPVKQLVFVRPTAVDGQSVPSQLQASTQANHRQYQIDYLPQIGHFRVIYTREKKSTTWLYPRENIQRWSPLEEESLT
jgi:hypothetical protein